MCARHLKCTAWLAYSKFLKLHLQEWVEVGQLVDWCGCGGGDGEGVSGFRHSAIVS